MNDDTYEEVVTFKLSRFSVYVALSSIFVLLVGLTVALIVFTPVKYYIPGYGSAKIDREYRQLKYAYDSLDKATLLQAQYINSLQKVFSGAEPVKLDTTSIQVPKDEVND